VTRRLPRGVVALGVVSLAMDTSSEMIHSLLPLFLVGPLGLGAFAVGLIEGIAESTAAITKVFAGVLSDWIGRRKPLVLAGYGLAALTKPLFALAPGAALVVAARFLDRVGKGIRGAPRDALVADLTPPALRGAAYGLRQSMDNVGAFAGPALAMLAMALWPGAFRRAFWIAVVPAAVAVAAVVFGVQEPDARPCATGRFPLRRAEVARLPTAYWRVSVLATLLTLARFSEAFLLLRASSVGLDAALVPAVMIVMNVVYAASAYPFGRHSDGRSPQRLLSLGIALLVAADLVLAAARGPLWVFAGAALWGLHMGATQGLLTALVAAASPEDLRGTAFGLFNLLTGVALLAASAVAGALWSSHGPAAPFLAGALLAAAALKTGDRRNIPHFSRSPEP
jgi:MFS family permease